ncbi:MAG: hypothetical protein B7Z83_11425 [Thiomonas sp. 20-64-5]|nr:MAG: hypothetical protein B7Z83_11425 [Thiomonas sp. 20-64-5]
MARNVLRDELVDAMRARVAHAWRHDPRALLIGLIKLVNAVSFAVLMLKPVGLKLGLWFGFCVASLSVAAALEKARMAQQVSPAEAGESDA